MVAWPEFLIGASHCSSGQKSVKRGSGKSRLIRAPRHPSGKPLSPRSLVPALEHSKVCNFPWLHMAHWQLAAVKRTGHANPAGQLRPRLDKMNGHSSSVPLGHPRNWCRSALGLIATAEMSVGAWSSSGWRRQSRSGPGCPGWAPNTVLPKGTDLLHNCCRSSFQSVARSNLKSHHQAVHLRKRFLKSLCWVFCRAEETNSVLQSQESLSLSKLGHGRKEYFKN